MLGLFERIRRHRRDPLAHEAHFVLGQDGNIAVAPAVQNAAHIISRKYRPHPRRFFRARGIDAQDARMGMRTAQCFRP